MVSFSACSLAQGSEAKKVQSHSTGQSQAQILGPTICEDKRKNKAESGTKPLRAHVHDLLVKSLVTICRR